MAWFAKNPEKKAAADKRYKPKSLVRDKRRRAEKDQRFLALEKARRARRGADVFRVMAAKRRALKKGAVIIRGVTKEDLEYLREMQSGLCAYCSEAEPLTLDHVVPLSKGGQHESYNCVLACKPCNSSKGAKSLEEFLGGRETLVFQLVTGAHDSAS